MQHLKLVKTVAFSLILTLAASQARLAQTSSDPHKDSLLNGLRVLIWPRPTHQNVLVKLRIHSGSAFDVVNKSGQMSLLGDILFPDPATREYFVEDMQGRLEVHTDFDSMTITLEGKASEFERIVEILRNALVATQLTADVVARIRDGRIKIVKETNISPTMLADRAIAKRLFGDFPYGSHHDGSIDSLTAIERGDLMLARDRFLNPNNATLAVYGGVTPSRAMRALRQLIGIWRKSETIVPATFRQPQPADTRTLIVAAPADQSAEIRLAVRGFARSDRDSAAAELLAHIVRNRWLKLMPELSRNPMFVKHEARMLPGAFVIGATVNNDIAAQAQSAAKEVMASLVAAPVPAAELEQAKAEVIGGLTKSLGTPNGLTEAWLDLDTYRLSSSADRTMMIQSVTDTELHRVAKRLFEQKPLAAIVVGDGTKLKELFPNSVALESGESPRQTTSSAPASIAKPD